MGIESVDAMTVSGTESPRITAPSVPPEYEGDEVISDYEEEEEGEGGEGDDDE